MDGFPGQLLAQGAIDQLVLLDAVQSGKGARHDLDLKMVATTGEIFDLEYIGNRVFIAGSFSSIRNNAPGNTTTYAHDTTRKSSN